MEPLGQGKSENFPGKFMKKYVQIHIDISLYRNIEKDISSRPDNGKNSSGHCKF